MTKLGLLCERLLEAGWLLALATIPLYFNVYSSRVFEPDKVVILRSLVLVMGLVQLVKWLEGVSSKQPRNETEKPAAARSWWPWRSTNQLAFPTLLVLATYVLATATSITPSISIWGSYQRSQGTYAMLSYVVLFFIVAANLRDRIQLERLFNVILLVSVPISFYGIVQHSGRDPLPWGGDVTTRVTASMGNAIFLAAYLIMVVPITLQRLTGTIARLADLGRARDGELTGGLGRMLALVGVLTAELVWLILFVQNSALPISLWWAALPMAGLVTATAVLFTVPRPTFLTTLAEAVGCVFLLALQLVAIVLTQSRGPWLGLLAGLAAFAIALFLRRRAKGLLVASSAIGLATLVFLIVFNLPNSPLGGLRQVPYVGRLGSLFETAEGGTGRVRILIWEGTREMLLQRPPIGLGSADPLGPARLLVGYGPEAMYVAYNKVYPPDLAHYEARNASPDRNHNDILDHIVETGFLGLMAYLLLLAAAGYLTYNRLRSSAKLADQLPILGILAALVAHFVESQTGIVIAATRTYFWVYLALLVAMGAAYGRGKAPRADVESRETPLLATAGVVGVGRAARGKHRRGARGATNVGGPGGRQIDARTLVPSGSGIAPYVTTALALVILAVMLILRVLTPTQDAVLPMVLAFSGLSASGVVIALGLGDWRGRFTWQSSNWWAYSLGAVVVAVLVLQNLNVIAADIYYKRGFGYDQARRFDMSIVEYNKAVQLAGDQDYYYLFLGRAFLELGKASQRPKAAPLFDPTIENLVALTPPQISALGKDDLLNASLVVLQKARDLNPLNTDHYANLGRLHRIWAGLGDPTKLAEAGAFYKQATTLSPQAAHLYDEWAQVDLEKGDIDGALEKAKTAAKIDPIFPTSFVVMGDAYLTAGQNDRALDAHGKAAELDPASLSDANFDRRFGAYEKANMLPRVEAMYEKATKTAPNSTQAQAAYGYVLSRQNKVNEALAAFQANVRLTPTDWVAYRNIALLYQSIGNVDEAIVNGQTALRYAPSDQKGSLQSFVNELQKK